MIGDIASKYNNNANAQNIEREMFSYKKLILWTHISLVFHSHVSSKKNSQEHSVQLESFLQCSMFQRNFSSKNYIDNMIPIYASVL